MVQFVQIMQEELVLVQLMDTYMQIILLVQEQD